MNNFLQLNFIPQSIDLGLLLLRVWLGMSLFVRHGIEKVFGFSDMLTHFPDPLHIGAFPSLVFATLSDGICSILIILGLFTRLSSVVVMINLFVIFTFLRGFSFVGDGQLVYVYLGGYIAIFVSGAGKYSIDFLLKK